jgi:hypothetical protein
MSYCDYLAGKLRLQWACMYACHSMTVISLDRISGSVRGQHVYYGYLLAESNAVFMGERSQYVVAAKRRRATGIGAE